MPIENFKKEDTIGFLLGRTHRVMSNQMKRRFAEAGHDLTQEQMIVLITLWSEDGCSQQRLADLMFKEKSSVTRLITNIEKRNLVLRVPDQNDRRNKLIYLTHQGKALKEEVMEIIFEMLDKAQANISETDLNTCKNVLRQIFKNFAGKEITE